MVRFELFRVFYVDYNICSLGVFLYKNFEMDFSWITTFPQCVHGVYDEEMEKIQEKYSRNYGIKEIPREHI